jgi:integrase
MIEEKAGRQYQDDMTPARSSAIRALRIQGEQLSNRERREGKREVENAEASRWTVNRLWQKYKEQKSLKGIAQDESRYVNYIKSTLGDKEPADILHLDVDRLRLKMVKKKSPQTVKLTLALLKRIINFGASRQLCLPLPFHIEMPKVHNEKTEDLTPDQLTRLLETIDRDHDLQAANLMRLALFTGMRRSELFKLRWDCVDFQRGFINIVEPKGGPGQKIPLNAGAREVLESHPRTDSPYVFPGRYGGRRTDIQKAVNRIKKSAGLPKDFRPLHGLRHVYASMLASTGQVDMYTLQKLLTHKSPQMTQRYAHLKDEALRRAADLAGTLIEQAVNGKNKAAEGKSA